MEDLQREKNTIRILIFILSLFSYHFFFVGCALIQQVDHDSWMQRDKLAKPHYLWLIHLVCNMDGRDSIYQSDIPINRAEIITKYQIF